MNELFYYFIYFFVNFKFCDRTVKDFMSGKIKHMGHRDLFSKEQEVAWPSASVLVMMTKAQHELL